MTALPITAAAGTAQAFNGIPAPAYQPPPPQPYQFPTEPALKVRVARGLPVDFGRGVLTLPDPIHTISLVIEAHAATIKAGEFIDTPEYIQKLRDILGPAIAWAPGVTDQAMGDGEVMSTVRDLIAWKDAQGKG